MSIENLKQNVQIPESVRWKNWRDIPIAFFDLEGTNIGFIPFDPEQGFDYWIDVNSHMRIVEFGCQIRQNNQLLDSYYVHVNPTIPIPEKATELHGITNEIVANCPTFTEVWNTNAIKDFLSNASVLCAYNGLGYDKDLLELEISRAVGYRVELSQYMIDPFILFKEIRKKKAFKGKSTFKGKNNLLEAASNFGCGQVAQIKYKQGLAHRTEPDVNMTADLLYKMGEKDLTVWTIDELAEFQDKAWNAQEEYAELKRQRKAKAKEKAQAETETEIKDKECF